MTTARGEELLLVGVFCRRDGLLPRRTAPRGSDLARTSAIDEELRIVRKHAWLDGPLRVVRLGAERGVPLVLAGDAHPPPVGARRGGGRRRFALERAAVGLGLDWLE